MQIQRDGSYKREVILITLQALLESTLECITVTRICNSLLKIKKNPRGWPAVRREPGGVEDGGGADEKKYYWNLEAANQRASSLHTNGGVFECIFFLLHMVLD